MVIRSHEYENLFFLISLLFIFKMLVGGENVFMTNPHIKICTHNTNYVLLLENTVVEHQRIRAMVFNATFSNISIISWQSALLMEETGLPKETHRPAASYFQTLSHDVSSSTPRREWDSNSQRCLSFYYDVAVGSIGRRNLSSGRKTTDLMQVIDKLLSHNH